MPEIHCHYCGDSHERALQVKACASWHDFRVLPRTTRQHSTTVEVPDALPAPRVNVRPSLTWGQLADILKLPADKPARYALPNPHDPDGNHPLLFQVKRGRLPGKVFVNAITSHGGVRLDVPTADQYQVLVRIAEDPAEAGRLYGEATEHCSRCGRFLSDPSSLATGFGPDCYEVVYGVKQPKVSAA